MSNILVAMSGGVDSAVAALLVLEGGDTAIGATMLLAEDNACCSSREVARARAVAERLGIAHHTVALADTFRREVIHPFVRAYERGETPNPCVLCNRHLKFGALRQAAKELGCSAVATGHYARVGYDAASGRYLLRRAAYLEKDQSYVLWTLSQEALAAARFPLGELAKREVREMAAAHGFENAHSAESQDICFVPDGDYAAYIRAYTGCDYPEGDFVDAEGRVLGTHRGILHYTIGQRKGLGLALGHPVFVTALHPAQNTVEIGEEQALWRKRVSLREVNLIAFDRLTAPISCQAKIRYRQTECAARFIPTGEDTAVLEFDSPVRAPARGQSAVLYDGDLVLGGGVIDG